MNWLRYNQGPPVESKSVQSKSATKMNLNLTTHIILITIYIFVNSQKLQF